MSEWHLLRAAVAAAATQHWRALRLIAPLPDPRTVAAEAVATHATALVQSAALWSGLHAITEIYAVPAHAAHIAASAPIDPLELEHAIRRLEILDHAAREWSVSAYGRQHQLAGELAQLART